MLIVPLGRAVRWALALPLEVTMEPSATPRAPISAPWYWSLLLFAVSIVILAGNWDFWTVRIVFGLTAAVFLWEMMLGLADAAGMNEVFSRLRGTGFQAGRRLRAAVAVLVLLSGMAALWVDIRHQLSWYMIVISLFGLAYLLWLLTSRRESIE
ncbi:hypothetical protein [Microbispora sp. H10949]|uniref:hypothetical protein n=1 Tax=Microbispora sp. H10949 TaxID=2729111 RepID=UPI001600951E|nr:hypothetical protein [Microbispora sp. H10949]